ncbi:hypothetical protein GCK72_004556 [Caenorhabditis remanei]|uniref:Uncharacterized protein n=1 Tax=Caenorhabditis remanei TaxID=31234 RepID=A0A6A5HBQ6_CAERE|nr:hypothetical protein GCK72_004556 [Caenorhabditis remanei]KAF1764607.1 hypothetical protein GCK72_004556 [Caenorhabditis remanei]
MLTTSSINHSMIPNRWEDPCQLPIALTRSAQEGFYCRKAVCTYWQPIKKSVRFEDQGNVPDRRQRKSKGFIKKNMRPGMNCKERYECPHGMTCTNGLCL